MLILSAVSIIILVRHAESIKNLRHIHGGDGDLLTNEGIEQLIGIKNRLIKCGCSDSDNSIIYHSQSIQTRETAIKLSELMGIDVIKSDLINSAHLGKLEALSDEEANRLQPFEYKLMTDWRKRKIEIMALKPLGIENPLLYWNKGERFISSLTKKNSIVVCSTSTMIMLTHLLIGNSPLQGGGYKHIPISNAQMICFNVDNGRTNVNEKDSDSDLLEYLI